MKTTQAKPRSTSPLSSDELGLAQRSKSIFARHTDKRGRLTFEIREGKEKESVVIPAAVARLFEDILTQMSEGNTVTIMPLQVEMTTQQAADWFAGWWQNPLPEGRDAPPYLRQGRARLQTSHRLRPKPRSKRTGKTGPGAKHGLLTWPSLLQFTTPACCTRLPFGTS
jgi:hypothetical protein